MKRMSLASMEYSEVKSSDPTDVGYYTSILNVGSSGANLFSEPTRPKQEEKVSFPYLGLAKSTRKRLMIGIMTVYYAMALFSITLRMWYW